MDGCTKGHQLEEDENLNTEAPGTRRTPPGGTSALARQVQRGPSPASVKENIDILRTMIKELDNQGQEKVKEPRLKSKSVKSKPQLVRASGKKSSSNSGLDPKSVDGFEELSNKFLEEFSQQKRYDKDPTEIHGIKRKPNEGLQAFMDRFKARLPRASKKLNDKIPKTVDKIWERVRAFIRVETAIDTTEVIQSPRREGFTPLTKTPKEILAMDNVNFPPPPLMVGTLEKQNMNKFCDYHQDRGHNTNDSYHLKKQIKEAVASGRLAHLVKDIKQSDQKSKASAKGKEKVINMVRSQGYRKRPYEKVKHWMDNTIAFPSVPQYQLMDFLVVVDTMIKGFRVRKIYVDGGSSSEIMYEHCFRNLSYRTRSRLRGSQNPLVGFSGEVNYPFGVIDLEVTMGETVMRSLGVVAPTIHSMIKFPTLNGIATIATTRETLRECGQIKEAQALSRHARITDPSLMQTSSKLDNVEERRQPDKGRKPPKSSVKEKTVVNDNYPEQLVTIGGGMSAEYRHTLIQTLRKNADVFAWTSADMIVRYPSWVSNPVLVKKVDGSWRMCIDFKDLNKACTKDLYLLPEIDWKIESLMGFKYKCFLDAYKGYHPTQMTKKDEEKMAFHTEEGVFCYTKMPFGLKNVGATYQRLVDSAFKEQIGVNLEAYVDDMVIKSQTE
ncbi:reverse transcriptase domain-containing protein [Tanacetum coccineum]